MKQIFQNLKDGSLQLQETPKPLCKKGCLTIQTSRSLISSGTERMLLEFGHSSWLNKAKAHPDKVKQVLAKLRTEGLFATYEAISNKLDMPISLGYCNVGTILEANSVAGEWKIGDRVLSNGPHAEIVCVPQNLCAKIPSNVSDDEAVFGVLSAIALQGVRLSTPTLGETFGVFGLGLIGLLVTQILKASGCHVIGIDFNAQRVALAEKYGAIPVNLSNNESPLEAARDLSNGQGIDGVIIASSSSDSGPIEQAAHMCRKRGRIILVGSTGLELSRADFYEKELSFQVSCSYGPGRYDLNYEQRGNDYPLPFVRWTAQRNFEAALLLMREKKLQSKDLITHELSFSDYQKAYDVVLGGQSHLGVLFKYPENPDHASKVVHLVPGLKPKAPSQSQINLGVIGAGNFASQVVFPLLSKLPISPKMIASQNGYSATIAARRWGFESATSDINEVLDNPDINAVVILTRHDTHAELVCRALKSGKHVFVEKPLALTKEQLDSIKTALSETLVAPHLMVGFNRRFAPHTQKMRKLLAQEKSPKCMVFTVNAGELPSEHWLKDPLAGGGRMIGEGCHFIDLLRYLADSPITRVQVGSTNFQHRRDFGYSVTLEFANESLGTLHYFPNGHRGHKKEKLEIFCNGKVLLLDNFQTLRGVGWANFTSQRLWRQDKGHGNELSMFFESIRSGNPCPIPFSQIEEVTLASFEAETGARSYC